MKQVSLFCIPSGTMGTLSSEVSMRFGLRGMSHVITTGCTSSTDAFGYALRQIQFGFLPMMLVGGVDAPIAPGIMKGFTLMKIMTSSWNHAPERASRPFSADRDGFVVAEGSWMFVLEEYEHARARGARILAEVAGYGSTCEAFHRVRLQECGEEPARAIQMAMEDAGIDAADVDYVNLHGTSTQLNDRIETRALKLALGEKARQTPMSSLKSQIGHPQGACGAAGIAATLVAMHHGQIPPTINLEKPDPECDLDYVPEAGGAPRSNMRCATASPSARRTRRWCCARSAEQLSVVQCAAPPLRARPARRMGHPRFLTGIGVPSTRRCRSSLRMTDRKASFSEFVTPA